MAHRAGRSHHKKKDHAAPVAVEHRELGADEASFLRMLNLYRSGLGLGALTLEDHLNVAALEHSTDMATNNMTGHNGSDGSGPAKRIERAGYHYDWCGENVYWGGETAAEAFAWWKQSPEHDENMRWRQYTEIGISRIYRGGTTYGWYWTNTFGTPRGT